MARNFSLPNLVFGPGAQGVIELCDLTLAEIGLTLFVALHGYRSFVFAGPTSSE